MPVAATEGAASAAEINDKVSKLSLRCAAAWCDAVEGAVCCS